MSDFGALLIVKSSFILGDKNKEPVRDKLLSLLEEKLSDGTLKYADLFGNVFKSVVFSINKKTLGVKLSEYWYGDEEEVKDDENDQNFQLAREADLELANELAQELRKTFPKFKFTIEFDEW